MDGIQCILGPDSRGGFQTVDNVPSSFANSNSCSRDECICSIHEDYLQISDERMASYVNPIKKHKEEMAAKAKAEAEARAAAEEEARRQADIAYQAELAAEAARKAVEEAEKAEADALARKIAAEEAVA